MAKVMQCDACKNVFKNEETMCVSTKYYNKFGHIMDKYSSFDLCTECYNRIIATFEINVQEVDAE